MKESKEQRLMNQYGISRSNETFYHFQGRKYQKLEDAVAYAKIIDSQNDKAGCSMSNDGEVEID